MPTFTIRLSFLIAGVALSVAHVAASSQLSSWPCAGAVAESAASLEPHLHGAAVRDQLVARVLRTLSPGPGQPRDALLELHRLEAGRGRYERLELWAPSEWQGVSGPFDLAFGERLLALQPGLQTNLGSHCDIVERGAAGLELTRLRLNGLRLGQGRLTTIVGETVFAVNMEGNFRIRLNVIGRDPAGDWQLQDEVRLPNIGVMWPLEDRVFVAAEQDLVVVAASRMQPLHVCAVVFARLSNGRWAHVGEIERPSTGPVMRLGELTGMALDGDALLLSFQRWPESATVWLYEQVNVGQFMLRQSFDGPELEPDIAAGGGRFALTRDRTTELYERSGSGQFTLARRFHGLERVFHLDAVRIAGRTSSGLAVRVAPLEPHGAVDVPVCQDRGAVVCEASAAAGPSLRTFFELTPPPQFWSRLVAGIEGARPGALAFAFRAAQLAPPPARNGVLCLDRTDALRAGPTVVDTFGRATVAFDVVDLPVAALFQGGLYIQALVLDGGTAAATEAVRLGI